MKNLNEIIGFLIVLFIFFFPLLRKLLIDKRGQKKLPVQEQDIEHEVEEQEEESHPFVPPPPITHRPFVPPSPITHRLVNQDFEFHSRLEKKEKKKLKKKERGPIVSLTRGRDPLQTMVILSEVFGSPKGME